MRSSSRAIASRSASPTSPSSSTRKLAVDEPVVVALKFGFLAVLYLFLLWVARSAMKDLRRAGGGTAAAETVEPPSPRRRESGLPDLRARGRRRHWRGRPVRVVRPCPHLSARRLHVRGGHGLHQRDLSDRPAGPHPRAAQGGGRDPHRRHR